MVQNKIHNSPLGLLDCRPQLNPLSSLLIEPAPTLRQPFGGLWDLHLGDLCSVLIPHVNLVHLVRPIHSQIISLHLLFLLYVVFPIPKALNGMFALYRSSTKGQLSMELPAPFFCWSGQSALDPLEGLGRYGPQSNKLVQSVFQTMLYSKFL